MPTPLIIIIIIYYILATLNDFVFYKVKKRVLIDIKYSVQIIILILIGYMYVLALYSEIIADNSSPVPNVLLIINVVVFSVYIVAALIRDLKLLRAIFSDYEPRQILGLFRYLLDIIIVFATIYATIYLFDSSGFTDIRIDSAFNMYVDFIYFSFLTFTTIGFNNIAVNSFAKIAAILECILFYITIGAGIKFFIQQKKSKDTDSYNGE